MSATRADVYCDASGSWRYRTFAGNGENIGGSEAYSRRWSAIRAVRKNTQAKIIYVFNRAGEQVRKFER